MSENLPPVEPIADEPKKDNKTMIIIIVAAVVLCCCCISILVLGYFLGDPLLAQMGLSY